MAATDIYTTYETIIQNYNNILKEKLQVTLVKEGHTISVKDIQNNNSYIINNTTDLHNIIKQIIDTYKLYKKCETFEPATTTYKIDRMNKEQYDIAVFVIKSYIQQLVDENVKYSSITYNDSLEPTNKTDFGDVDMIIQINDSSNITGFLQKFNSNYDKFIYACKTMEPDVRGYYEVSYSLNIEGIPFPVAVDFIFVKSLEVARLYHSYFGPLFGWIIGLYFNYESFKFIFSRDGLLAQQLGKNVAKVSCVLTDEYDKIIKILNYIFGINVSQLFKENNPTQITNILKDKKNKITQILFYILTNPKNKINDNKVKLFLTEEIITSIKSMTDIPILDKDLNIELLNMIYSIINRTEQDILQKLREETIKKSDNDNNLQLIKEANTFLIKKKILDEQPDMAQFINNIVQYYANEPSKMTIPNIKNHPEFNANPLMLKKLQQYYNILQFKQYENVINEIFKTIVYDKYKSASNKKEFLQQIIDKYCETTLQMYDELKHNIYKPVGTNVKPVGTVGTDVKTKASKDANIFPYSVIISALINRLNDIQEQEREQETYVASRKGKEESTQDSGDMTYTRKYLKYKYKNANNRTTLNK